MKRIVLALSILGFVSCSSSKAESVWNLLTDSTVVSTASVGFLANVLPDHIATNDSGLIFALCINYLLLENKTSLFERIPKFAAAYIAGGVAGRMVKELRKLQAQQVKPAVSEKVTENADSWASC